MRVLLIIPVLFFAHVAVAQVVINEVQVSPIGERFVELYNSSSSDVDLAGWYIQRKTATGSSFGSLVTNTQLKDKTIKAGSYFLVSRVQSVSSDVVIDNLTLTESNSIRIRDSKGADVDQVEWATIGDGKSYQRTTASEWAVGAPTPGAPNIAAVAPAQDIAIPQQSVVVPVTSNTSSFLVEPQIIADAGSVSRTVSAGAQTAFNGRVFGLKKEPIENARMTWAFGDGAYGEGSSVLHTYYYPGDYIAVLDAASGYFSASDRVAVHVVAPLLTLRTGGDPARSFVSIENRGTDETDLSLWQVEAQGKIFTLPQNTILGAKKILTLASEVTGLVTSQGSVAILRFPNGAHVDTLGETILAPAVQAPDREVIVIKQAEAVSSTRILASKTSAQEASIANAFVDDTPDSSAVQQESDSLWPWYIGAAFLGVLALLGLRTTRGKVAESPRELTADDFEIVEDEDSKDSIF